MKPTYSLKTHTYIIIYGRVYVQLLSHVHLFATLWTVAHKAPLSLGILQEGCWSGLPLPYPGYLPNPGIKAMSPAPQANSFLTEPLGKPHAYSLLNIKLQLRFQLLLM